MDTFAAAAIVLMEEFTWLAWVIIKLKTSRLSMIHALNLEKMALIMNSHSLNKRLKEIWKIKTMKIIKDKARGRRTT
jgi:hypothetical protein